MRWTTIAVFAVCLACGPLDRRDGALVIQLERVPDAVDAIRVKVTASSRVFEAQIVRPSDDRITQFSAIPAGRIHLDLALLVGGRTVDSAGVDVDVIEDQSLPITVNFEDGPEFEIVEPAEEPFRLFGAQGFIPVQISLANAALEVTLTAVANGEEIPLNGDGGSFSGTIDPALVTLLPGTITLEVTACLARALGDCRTRERSFEVTRAPWRKAIAADTLGRPQPFGDAIALVDGDGVLRVVTSSSGEDLPPSPLALSATVTEDLAIVGDTAYVVASDGRLFSISLTAGARAEVIGVEGVTSAPVLGPSGAIVAAGTDLISIDDRRLIAQLPRRVRAAPLADVDGIAAADILGNVLALDASENMQFTAAVGAPVFAKPVRYQGRLVIATNNGALIQLDAAGVEAVPRIELGPPIFHAPLVVDERLVVAAGDRVFFIAGDHVEASTPVQGAITGAPARWIDGSVVVGVQNGAVRLVTDTGSRIIERVAGAALGPLVLESLGLGRGAGIAVVGSDGDLAMLELERDF